MQSVAECHMLSGGLSDSENDKLSDDDMYLDAAIPDVLSPGGESKATYIFWTELKRRCPSRFVH